MIIINNTAGYAESAHSSLVFFKQKPDYRETKKKKTKQNICPDGVEFSSNKKRIVLCRVFSCPVRTERIRFKIRIRTCMFSIRPQYVCIISLRRLRNLSLYDMRTSCRSRTVPRLKRYVFKYVYFPISRDFESSGWFRYLGCYADR